MESKHRVMINLAWVVLVLRLVSRTVFVIVTETTEGIALICTALIAVPILLHLKTKGGCSATVLYAIVEPIFGTIYWCLVIFVFNTDNMCHKLGNDVCESLGSREVSSDFVRRPFAWWVVLMTPGLLFDFVFLVFFRKPV